MGPTSPLHGLLTGARRRGSAALAAALALYLLLAAGMGHALGLVGEVAIGWALDSPPRVLVSVDPPILADDVPAAGPLLASQVRPLERLAPLGPAGPSLPLAINRYTGGPPDWPAALLYRLSGSLVAVQVLHVALGGLLLALAWRLLRYHGTDISAAVAALVLASDWMFLFYKRALGGTEVLLQASLLLCLWAAWSRRWGGGRHGLPALAAGVGLGLMAKLTFALPLLGLLVALALTRRDHPPNLPPDDRRWRQALLLLALLTAPLWITALHHGLALPAAPRVQSHDFPGLQAERVLRALAGQQGPAREGLANLARWALDPLSFFPHAYGAPAEAPGPGRLLRAAGWLVGAAGSLLAWRDRHPTPHTALLRLLSLALPLQVAALWLAARDLHHLAMLAPLLAIWFGLAAEHLCALAAPPRSLRRAALALLLALPWILAGARDARRTDAVIAAVPVATFTAAGQRELVGLLRAHDVRRLVACDYELYGMIEVLAPEVEVTHLWGAASRQEDGLVEAMLRQAAGGHLLTLRASAPMIYNLRPSKGQLGQAAAALGLEVREVARLSGGGGALYAVTSPAGSR